MNESLTRSLESNRGHARIKLREVFSGGPVVSKQRQEGLNRLAQLVADLLPDNDAVAERNRTLLARGVVAAADAYFARLAGR